MSTENGIATWFPLAAGVALFAATGLRSLHMRIRHGVNPYVIDHGKPVEGFVGAVFFVLVAVVVVYLALLAGWGTPAWLGPVAGPSPAREAIALVLMGASVAWTVFSEIAMGASWRVGIPGVAPPLRTNGPFRLSRNPIFLGMLGFVLGLAVLTPNVVTITALVAAYLAISVQIRLEEVFLGGAHGAAYHAYRARVRRWL